MEAIMQSTRAASGSSSGSKSSGGGGGGGGGGGSRISTSGDDVRDDQRNKSGGTSQSAGDLNISGENPLQLERFQATINVNEIASALAGSNEVLVRRREIRNVIESDEVMKVDDYYFSDRMRRFDLKESKKIEKSPVTSCEGSYPFI